MYGWIEPFYEPTEPAIEPGQIWCDQPLHLPPRHALKIGRVNPKDDTRVDFTISERTADVFDHPPIHSLKLGADEGVAVAKVKRNRPVIVLGGTTATELRPESTQHAGTVMVIPVYGADQYDEQTRERIAHYEFTNAFYLPACKQPGFDEGFARLDQAQPVLQSHLVEHRGLKLSSDALDALVEWFVAFSTNRLPEDSVLLEYRREMLAKD